MPLHGRADIAGPQIQQVRNEIIRMLSLCTVRAQAVLREVLQVEGHDHVSPGSDRGGKDMSVVGVRKTDRRDEILVAGDQAIPNMAVHEIPRAFELVKRQVRPIPQDARHPFPMDVRRPSRPEEIGHGEAHEEVAQRRGVQHARVIERRERHHGSVAHVQFLRLFGELVEDLVPLGVDVLLVSHEVAEEDPPVGPHLPVGDGPLRE